MCCFKFWKQSQQKKFEDTKGVICEKKSEAVNRRRTDNKKHNGQKKKYKTTNNDLQNITQKTNYKE